MKPAFSVGYRRMRYLLSLLAFGLCALALLRIEPSHYSAAPFAYCAMLLAKMLPIDLRHIDETTLSPAIDIMAAISLGAVAAPLCALAGISASLVLAIDFEAALSGLKSTSKRACEVAATAIAGFFAASPLLEPVYARSWVYAAVLCGALYLLVHLLLESASGAVKYNVEFWKVPSTIGAKDPRFVGFQIGLSVFATYAFGLLPRTLGSLVFAVAFTLLVLYAGRLYVQMRSAYWATILTLLAAIENEFVGYSGHAKKVAAYSIAIARKLGFCERDALMVYVGALLSRIGMVGVDAQSANRESVLTPTQRREIEQYALVGAGIVGKVPLLSRAEKIVRHHHERWDGSGYPDGLKTTDIPIGARIAGIADTFVALCSARPHRAALSPDQAADVIRDLSGIWFDPGLFGPLMRVIQDEARWGTDAFVQHYSVVFDR